MLKPNDPTYHCDLCNYEKNSSSLPQGWFDLEVESRFLDRSWHTKHICDGCKSRILDRIKARCD